MLNHWCRYSTHRELDATLPCHESYTNHPRRHNPVGKVFSRDELQAIGDLCVKHNIIILSDEVCLLSSISPSCMISRSRLTP